MNYHFFKSFLFILTGLLLFSTCEDKDKEDTTPPTITITSPQNGSTVSELVSITCVSSDNEGVEKVDLWVDENSTGVTDETEPYSLDWKTTTYEDGSYTIIVRSYDTNGNTTDSAPITLTVDNSGSYPTSVELYPVSYQDDSFTITWSQNNDNDFSSYELYESMSEDMSDKTLIYETTENNDTSYVVIDIRLNESRYYQIVVKDILGLETYSSIVLGSSFGQILFNLEPRLDQDVNGYYHLELNPDNIQTLHRISGHIYRDSIPIEFVEFNWESSHYWTIGDTLGYFIHIGLTDDLVYISYDTTYITGFSDFIVPTINCCSYSNSEGEVNTMFGPVWRMRYDTVLVSVEYYNNNILISESIEIVLD